MSQPFIQTNLLSLPFNCIYPIELGVRIQWPTKINHQGLVFYWDHKVGVDKEAMPCALYRHLEPKSDRRIWLRCDGQITED